MTRPDPYRRHWLTLCGLVTLLGALLALWPGWVSAGSALGGLSVGMAWAWGLWRRIYSRHILLEVDKAYNRGLEHGEAGERAYRRILDEARAAQRARDAVEPVSDWSVCKVAHPTVAHADLDWHLMPEEMEP